MARIEIKSEITGTVWQLSHGAVSCPRWTSSWQLAQVVGRFRYCTFRTSGIPVRTGCVGPFWAWHFSQVSDACCPPKKSGALVCMNAGTLKVDELWHAGRLRWQDR